MKKLLYFGATILLFACSEEVATNNPDDVAEINSLKTEVNIATRYWRCTCTTKIQIDVNTLCGLEISSVGQTHTQDEEGKETVQDIDAITFRGRDRRLDLVVHPLGVGFLVVVEGMEAMHNR